MSKYIAVTTIHFGRLDKDADGKSYSKTEVINPGQELPNDMTKQQVAELVRSESACEEKNFDRVNKVRAQRAALYAPDLVSKETESEDYDPIEEAKKLNAEESAKKSDKKPEDDGDKNPSTTPPAGDDGKDKKPEGKEPKPSMSKADLLEIAKERNIEVDETMTRDEIYKTYFAK